MQKLDLKDAVHVGHSTGGGEVARYIGRHGTKRVAKGVLIGAVPPLMLKTAANPGGLPIGVFDGIRQGVLSDRSAFFMDLTLPFYGYNRPDAKVSEGVRESFWLQGMMAGMPASYFCIKAFSETDQTEDLKKIDKPTLILHGDDDQIVPIGASALLSSKLVKGATLKVYKGAPHGMCTTLKDEVNADLLAFIKGWSPSAAPSTARRSSAGWRISRPLPQQSPRQKQPRATPTRAGWSRAAASRSPPPRAGRRSSRNGSPPSRTSRWAPWASPVSTSCITTRAGSGCGAATSAARPSGARRSARPTPRPARRRRGKG